MEWAGLIIAAYGAYQKSQQGGGGGGGGYGGGGGGGGGQVGGSTAHAAGYIDGVTDHSGWMVNFGNGNSASTGNSVAEINPNLLMLAGAALFIFARAK